MNFEFRSFQTTCSLIIFFFKFQIIHIRICIITFVMNARNGNAKKMKNEYLIAVNERQRIVNTIQM